MKLDHCIIREKAYSTNDNINTNEIIYYYYIITYKLQYSYFTALVYSITFFHWPKCIYSRYKFFKFKLVFSVIHINLHTFMNVKTIIVHTYKVINPFLINIVYTWYYLNALSSFLSIIGFVFLHFNIIKN